MAVDSSDEAESTTTADGEDGPLMKMDPKGDVILLLKDKKRVLVASKVLSVASPYFRAMFDSRMNFHESQSLSVESPPTVEFPDDDPLAMVCFCCFLHHISPKSLINEVEDLLALVVLADKFNAMESLRDHVSRHLLRTLGSGRIVRYGNYNDWATSWGSFLDALVVSYAAQDMDLFRDISSTLIFDSNIPVDSFVHAGSRLGGHLVNPALWCTYGSRPIITWSPTICRRFESRLTSPQHIWKNNAIIPDSSSGKKSGTTRRLYQWRTKQTLYSWTRTALFNVQP